MELDDIIEMLANNDKPFLLAISKTSYRLAGGPGERTLATRWTEVLNIFGDKDEAVAKLFDLTQLYNWQIQSFNWQCEAQWDYVVKFEIELFRVES